VSAHSVSGIRFAVGELARWVFSSRAPTARERGLQPDGGALAAAPDQRPFADTQADWKDVAAGLALRAEPGGIAS
jgi:hypothetical protein